MKFSLAALALLPAAYAAPAPGEYDAVVSAVGNMTNNLLGHTQQLAQLNGVSLDQLISVPGVSVSSQESAIVARDWKEYLPLIKTLSKDVLVGLSAVLTASGYGPFGIIVKSISGLL